MKGDLLGGIKYFFSKNIEPFFYSKRLQRRLAAYKFVNPFELASVKLEPNPGQCCSVFCLHLTNSYGHNLQRYMAHHHVPSLSESKKLILHAIKLDDYKTYLHYQNALKKNGNFFFRQMKSAIAKQYTVNEFRLGEQDREISEIFASMKVRSFGPVLRAFFQGASQSNASSTDWNTNLAIPCQSHWEVFFGVFMPTSGSPVNGVNSPAKLISFATLHRIGNIISYKDCIGHGLYLKYGVTKLLHAEIMRWILDSGDPRVVGVQYLVHGSLQRGGDGFFFWKKKALFEPCLISSIDGLQN
jgi:hypothetical protein